MNDHETGSPKKISRYDFRLADEAKELKHNLDTAEVSKQGFQEGLDNIIDQAASKGLDAEAQYPFEKEATTGVTIAQLGRREQEMVEVAQKEVDNAFNAAKEHYQENQDQYVANGLVEDAALEKAKEDGEQKAA